MAPAPVPPHERPWRHPSEIGPPPHEPTTTSGRALLVASAAMGFVVIAILAVAITPGRSSPTAIESSTSPQQGTAFEPDLVGIVSIARQPLTATATTSRTDERLIVTPIGSGGFALMTLDAVQTLGAAATAQLPTGEVVTVDVVSVDDVTGVAMVSLPEPVLGGYELADRAPGPDETVLVGGSESTVVPMRDVAGLEVEEGAPVVDNDGELVGLCSDDERGTEEILGLVPASMPAAPPASSTVDSGVSDVTGDAGATTAPD